mmetsp:Transcript_37110/g.102422  ORF Transcript_37110/g.102422 Transcript_37110/m.102422 type:complete len:217 (+) Transcript_37110:1001-1651(+)
MTQKTRIEQLAHTLDLRRMVDRSSCSPPSWTTHQMSMYWSRRASGLGTWCAPLSTIRARLYEFTSLKSLTIRRARASSTRLRVVQLTQTVLGARPPRPAVWMRDVRPWSTSGVMITCVKPRILAESRASRSETSTRLRSSACLATRPGTTEPRMERPRPPLSCLTKVSAPRWLIMRPGASRSTLHIIRICGRQFLVCVSLSAPNFSSSISEERARS